MDYENIILEQEGNVATITLNRPRVLNALNAEIVGEILDAISSVSADDDVRALVFTGAGRGFCSGDDISKQGLGTPLSSPPGKLQVSADSEVFRLKWHMMYKTIRNLRKPVIAAVNGNAHGAGSDLMLACDLRMPQKTLYWVIYELPTRSR